MMIFFFFFFFFVFSTGLPLKLLQPNIGDNALQLSTKPDDTANTAVAAHERITADANIVQLFSFSHTKQKKNTKNMKKLNATVAICDW
jgi:hypothetical protein